MPEETPKTCLTCRKDDNKTREPCPTRKDCFFPDYDNWEGIAEKPEEDKENPAWSIVHFSYDKEKDRMIFSLDNESGRSILVELSGDEIAKLY